MKIITIKGKDYNIYENWNEITIEDFYKIKSISDNKDLILEQIVMMVIEAISDIPNDVLMNLLQSETTIIAPYVKNFDLNTFEAVKQTEFTFGDVLYTTVIPQELTNGEYISQKVLDKKYPEVIDKWLNILSILIRPATEKTNEFGEKYYVPDAFSNDISILEKRKEFIKKIPAIHGLWIINAFTYGRTA